MDVGIGLPSAVSGTSGAELVEWARRAEARGFATLGTIDRVVFSNWAEAGRESEPRTMSLAYFSLGERAAEDARAYAHDHYNWLGADAADYLASTAAQDAEAVRRSISAFEEAGCEELILFPSSSDPDQVDLLAEAVGG